MPATPTTLPPFDPNDHNDRWDLVAEVRRQIGDKHGTDYERRCGECAVYMLNALRQMNITAFRIAAGGVDALVTSTKGHLPGPRWTGVYTQTGRSDYHVWLVNDAGEKLDCSELPIEYNKTYMWEPYEPLPGLSYIEVPATTQALIADIDKKYKL